MTTITPERVKELKSFFGAKHDDLIEMDKQAAAEDDPSGLIHPIYMSQLVGPYYRDVLAVLDDYSSLRAGNDRLLVKSISDNEALKTATADRESLRRLLREALASAQDKAAQLEKVKSDLIDESKRRAAIAESLQAHQDQLEKQRPLIEAVGSDGGGEIEWDGRYTTKAAGDILRAALTLREKKGEKE